MHVRRFNNSDLTTVNAWYADHNQPMVTREALPSVGFVVEGIAAGFIYYTDSTVAFLDGYISSLSSINEERKSALDLITEALLTDAESKEFKLIVALTNHKSIEQRCLNYGFKQSGNYFMYLKELN